QRLVPALTVGFDGGAGVVYKCLRNFRVDNRHHARSNVQWRQRRQLDVVVVHGLSSFSIAASMAALRSSPDQELKLNSVTLATTKPPSHRSHLSRSHRYRSASFRPRSFSASSASILTTISRTAGFKAFVPASNPSIA